MSDLNLENIVADEESVKILADYLGYTVGMNPVTENSDWRILFTDKLPDHSKGVLAVLPMTELTEESSTVEVRRLYKKVLELKDEFSTGFEVQIVGFVGNKRIIFFPYQNGNRDMRLDLNTETLEIRLYKDNLALLKNDAISVKEDEFGFGAEIQVDAKVFKQQLSTHFLSVVAYYRKKLSELITSSQLKNSLVPLLDSYAKFWLDKNDLVNLVEQESYTAVLSNVVDTIILRQLMRRFLEGYYGSKSFEVEGIALGVGDRTMDEAIKKAIQAYVEIGDEDAIKKLNKKKKAIEEIDNSISLFEGFFDEDELGATTKVELETDSKAKVKELTEKATEQFQAVYNGDLFAGSVGTVANQIENQMATDFPEVTAKLWLDTSAKEYSFRYEDLPPYAIEKQYENSMSQNVQIKIEDGQPIVFYGEDTIEQKNKGAYYTDDKFVDYMVKQTVDVEFNKRYEAIKQAISEDKKSEIRKTILHLLDLKVADLTSGGGSFLRGAFLHLAGKQALLATLEIPQGLKNEFTYFEETDESVYQWEKYVLEHMIYGVDIDYKAIIVSSLTLTLSSLEHRPADMKLPSLIGQNLIHQNSLMNSVPYYLRKEIFEDFKDDIKLLRRAKVNHQINFNEKREKLQQEFKKYVAQTLNGETEFLRVEALEINLPEVFFDENGCLLEDGGFDVIIGNPPWEVWKPNSDEFFSSYDETYLALGKAKEKKKRQEELFNRFSSLKGKWDEYEGRFEKGSKYFRDDNNFKYQSWQVDGKEVTGSTTFTAKKANGTVDVNFTFDASALEGKTIVVFEKLFQNGKEVASHEDINDKGQTVEVPKKPEVPVIKIGTTAVDAKDDDKEVAPEKNVTIKDTVKYENLVVGKEYTVTGKLMDKSTNKPLIVNGKEVTGSTTFTAKKANGTVDVNFTFDASALEGKTIVVFEKLFQNGKEVASHEDINDKGQTVEVPKKPEVPVIKIGTTAVDAKDGDKNISAEKNVTIKDTVKYENLVVGKEYTVTGKLMDKSTNKPLLVDGKEVTGSTTFTAKKANGTVDVNFTFDASALEGKTIVVFEKLFQNGKEVVSHEDINDKAQTVTVEVPKKPSTPSKPNTNRPNVPGQNLPSTGENELLTSLFMVAGFALLLLASIFVVNKKRNA